MNKSLNPFEKVITILEKVAMFTAAIVLVAMVILIVMDTILRHFFHSPIVGVLEVVEGFFMVAIVYFGISDTFRVGEHIKVDLLSKKFYNNIKKMNEIILNLIVTFFFIIIGIRAWEQLITALNTNQTTTGALEIPIAPAYLIVVIGTFLFSLRLLLTIFKLTFYQVKEG